MEDLEQMIDEKRIPGQNYDFMPYIEFLDHYK